MSEGADKGGSGMMEFFRGLVEDYGWKLLVMLFFAQHVVKGFVYAFSLSGTDFVMKEYNTTGPDLQTYKAFILLPWGMKPLFGLLSDCCPVFGYRKIPYMLFAISCGLAGLAYVGFAPVPSAPLLTIVVAMFGIIVAVAVTDLLTEAKYAERLRHVPERGPDLMTFVWGGMVVAGLAATLLLGPIITHFGPQMLYVLALPALAIALVPLAMNYLGDEKLSEAQVAATRAKVWNQPEMLFLTGLIATGVVSIAVVSLAGFAKSTNAIVALVMGLTVIAAFLILTSPVIGKMNAFTVLQTFSAISIDGATFYFFTNNASQFKGGPNFSIWFYTTGLGILVAVCNIIGLWTYNKYMKEWNYQTIFFFSNLLVSAVHLWGILIYSRYNLTIGIPDHTFALTTAAMFSITHQWMWMPNVLLLGQLCPAGVEATMYALLAGCHNLGSSGAAMMGAYALEWFGITPNGSENEGHRFDQLWKVALLGCILPTLTIAMIPVCIPDAKQTERLLDDSHMNATDGSPWQRWRKRYENESTPLTA
jgi:MFS family permease